MRVYQAVSIHVGQSLQLDEAASHHLSRVLRVKVGESLRVFNGQGGEYIAVIQQIEKKHITVAVTAFDAREVESPISITLAQGIARGEKMDFIIQKAVELGVNHIQPLITERCNVRLSGEREEKRLMHWQAIIQSACEQCGRNRLPTVSMPLSLSAWLSQVKAMHRYVLTPWQKTVNLSAEKLSGDFALLIGPEGGLSDDEIAWAMKHQFEALQLGPRVLRTETAAMAAVSVIQVIGGDF